MSNITKKVILLQYIAKKILFITEYYDIIFIYTCLVVKYTYKAESARLYLKSRGKYVSMNNIGDINFEEVMGYVSQNVDAILVVDGNSDSYRSVIRRGLFAEMLEETGSYHDLIEKLWFHFNNTAESVIDDYLVFVPNTGRFIGKYG